MSDKSPSAVGPLFALPDQAVITLQGRDAIAFSQAQTMNDVTALSDGQWQWSGWLTPKGRVVALFALIRLDEQTLWLIVPDTDAAELAQRLRGFLFRSKVVITVRDDLQVAGRFVPASPATGNQLVVDAGGRTVLDLGGDAQARSLVIGTDLGAEADDSAVDRWRVADLEHGFPRLDASQVEQWTPQQLSLERLPAFSVKKGCYPGQEIVARTHFLGKAKRGLALLESESPMAVGADVAAADATLGRIAASASTGERHVALAVLPLEHDATALSVDGQAVRETALKDGLAR